MMKYHAYIGTEQDGRLKKEIRQYHSLRILCCMIVGKDRSPVLPRDSFVMMVRQVSLLSIPPVLFLFISIMGLVTMVP